MNDAMPPNQFTSLLERIAEAGRGGALLSEMLYQEVLEQIPIAEDDGDNEAIALAARQLSPFCDWSEFGLANDYLGAGGCVDDLHLEIQRINDDLKRRTGEGTEYDRSLRDLVDFTVKSLEGSRQSSQAMRNLETLMGFDQEATNKLIAPLGTWDKMLVPNSLFELLPEEVTFPLRKTQRSTPYDHRIHLLVQELASRLGVERFSDDVVVRHCGHVLAELLLADDREAASRLVLTQVTLLAEEFVQRHPFDVLGLCWRGELACWAGDEGLAEEYAKRVWDRTTKLSAKEVNEVTSFFAWTTDLGGEWWSFPWDGLDGPQLHLGEIKSSWLGVERPLAHAVVRNAFRRGVWDTPLLCSTFKLRENTYDLESDDLPLECWVWIAENIPHLSYDNEFYYVYWLDAFKSLASDTDPALAHNVLVVLLASLLFNNDMRMDYDVPSIPIQEVLSRLTDTYRADSMARKKQAALEMLKYVYAHNCLDHLTAADRLAFTKAINDFEIVPKANPIVEALSLESTESSDNQIHPSNLDGAEVEVRKLIGEVT